MPDPIRQLTVSQFAELLDAFVADPATRRLSEVHLHHTWRPRHADFRGLATVEAMRRVHMEVNGWADIAQHLTIDPTGGLWSGRSWNARPASQTGRNGTPAAGPFMIEMIGDFDIGQDPFVGAQRDAAVEVVALVLATTGTGANRLYFHRELGSPKTCPGTSIDKADLAAAIDARRRSLRDARPRPGARRPPAPFAVRHLFGPGFLRGPDEALEPATAGVVEDAATGRAIEHSQHRAAEAGRRAIEPGTGRGRAPREARARAKPAAKPSKGTATFSLGRAVTATSLARPYQPVPDDPPERKLLVYTQDPATSRFDAAIAEVSIPYEPLAPGPTGHLFEVVDFDDTSRKAFKPLELDTVTLALEGGLTPSTTDPRFAQQMTYTLASSTYHRFARALGRHPDFGFSPGPGESRPRLKIRPHGMVEENAWYDPDARELAFGYFKAGAKSRFKTQKGDRVYTSLSHDVVVHEMSHALLDGIRTHFLLPTNLDVSAFHEGFADLVAVFQRFTHRELVRHAIGAAGGSLASHLITEMARQFGQTASDGDGRTALRTAILDSGGPDDDVLPKFRYDRNTEEHDRGAVLVTAVFEAFRRVFERKTAKLRSIVPAASPPPPQLLDELTGEARSLAGQFLSIVIRAVDYCPPVDLTYGEYLRALVTADADTVKADPWGYREALVLAFRRYGVTVPNVPDLSEEALVWQPPEAPLPQIADLAYDRLKYAVRPEWDPGPEERRRRAEVVGTLVTTPEFASHFGLHTGHDPAVERPVVQSIRTLRRISPDLDLQFNLVAEITQRRKVRFSPRRSYWFYGGSTVVIDADGKVRFVIAKSVDSEARLERFRTFVPTLDADTRSALEADEPDRASLYRRLHTKGKGMVKVRGER
jgi:hypothetical protein